MKGEPRGDVITLCVWKYPLRSVGRGKQQGGKLAEWRITLAQEQMDTNTSCRNLWTVFWFQPIGIAVRFVGCMLGDLSCFKQSGINLSVKKVPTQPLIEGSECHNRRWMLCPALLYTCSCEFVSCYSLPWTPPLLFLFKNKQYSFVLYGCRINLENDQLRVKLQLVGCREWINTTSKLGSRELS